MEADIGTVLQPLGGMPPPEGESEPGQGWLRPDRRQHQARGGAAAFLPEASSYAKSEGTD